MADEYTIASQRETQTMVGGTFQKAMEVTFTTASGTTASVVVPVSQYNADSVREAIEARVKDIDAVSKL